MKSVALLTIALFFTVAPSPDAKTLSEMTGGFLKVDDYLKLAAAEFNPEYQAAFIDLNLTFRTDSGF